jgi:phosphoribosylamine--glycine ligase
LCATALGDTVALARAAAYALVDTLHFDGMQYRRDIGHLALAREQARPA